MKKVKTIVSHPVTGEVVAERDQLMTDADFAFIGETCELIDDSVFETFLHMHPRIDVVQVDFIAFEDLEEHIFDAPAALRFSVPIGRYRGH